MSFQCKFKYLERFSDESRGRLCSFSSLTALLFPEYCRVFVSEVYRLNCNLPEANKISELSSEVNKLNINLPNEANN